MSLENLNNYFKLEVEPRYQSIPPPREPLVRLESIAPEQQLAHAVWHTYDPASETEALKASPGQFYHFRSHYPPRREYHAYTICQGDASISAILNKLGFSVNVSSDRI